MKIACMTKLIEERPDGKGGVKRVREQTLEITLGLGTEQGCVRITDVPNGVVIEPGRYMALPLAVEPVSGGFHVFYRRHDGADGQDEEEGEGCSASL